MKNNERKIAIREIIIIAVVMLLFLNLMKSWVKLNSRLQFIKEAKIRLVEEQKREENLKRDLARTQTPEFIESQARDKLNMAREGELIILLPTPVIAFSPTPMPIDTAANWQKWMRLFL